MLEVSEGPNGEIVLAGRFDASQMEVAKGAFLQLTEGKTVDFSKLDYISSAGLGILLAAQKNLSDKGQGLKLIHVNGHIRDVFRLSGFDQIFDIA